MTTYNYKLENYSSEYAQLLERRQKITQELDQVAEVMSGIDQKQAAAKEQWLQSEVDALLDSKKAGLVEKNHDAYKKTTNERKQLADRAEILRRAGEAITEQIESAKEEAKLHAINAAVSDHKKIVVKSLKILRELAKAQQEELEIVNALGYAVGMNGRLMPTYGMTVYLGSEQTYGDLLFNIAKQLRDRGYNV